MPVPDPPSRRESQTRGQTAAEMMESRSAYTKFFDPCKDASKASMDCMNKNDFDRDACLHVFEAYRECKKQWMNQMREDRRAGRIK